MTSHIFLVLLLGLLTAQGCTDDRMGMIVPNPGSKPAAGEIPSGDPFNPDTPPGPVDPTDPTDPWSQNPERLARLGKTPIIEIYYTEYTRADLFPSLEEVRNFTHINVGHARFQDKDNGTGIAIDPKSIPLIERFVAYKAQYPELKVKVQMGGWGKNADGWSQMAGDPVKRKAFVEACVDMCNT